MPHAAGENEKPKKNSSLTPTEAAVIIQRSWRKHIVSFAFIFKKTPAYLLVTFYFFKSNSRSSFQVLTIFANIITPHLMLTTNHFSSYECFQDVQVFRYYRDLINFKSRGDPAMMLRCINPNEAKLLDAATGVHIKFRLAGVSNLFRNTAYFIQYE